MSGIQTLEQSLNGGYPGLYGEVVTEDCYKVKNLPFVPDIVFDIGANVGIFTRWSREMWPTALVIAVEPHPDNLETFRKFTCPEERGVWLVEAALGRGQMWHNIGAVNGSGESYVASGLGYPEEVMALSTRTGRCDVPTIMLPELGEKYWKSWMKSLIKIDCEGAENVIWDDPESMDFLRKMDYITMELHFYAIEGGPVHEEMLEKTHEALRSLMVTHNCYLDHIHFIAIKKNGDN